MTVGITAAVYKGDFSEVLKNGLKKSMKNYSNNEADKIAWDNVQIKVNFIIDFVIYASFGDIDDDNKKRGQCNQVDQGLCIILYTFFFALLMTPEISS